MRIGPEALEPIDGEVRLLLENLNNFKCFMGPTSGLIVDDCTLANSFQFKGAP